MTIDMDIEELITLTHVIADNQDASGSIPSDRVMTASIPAVVARASALAQSLARHFEQDAVAEAIAACTKEWARTEFAQRPDFGRVRSALVPPADGRMFFFWGPLRLANGAGRVGWLFECFLSQREEPRTPEHLSMYDMYPHPKNICQSAKLITGTKGLVIGNNIVFFPENICSVDSVESQKYAIFFFNKFRKIFHEITIRTWDAVGDPSMLVDSRRLTSRSYYDARCVWGYLHDYFHYQGHRPFDTNIGIKTRWYTGLLEELKVDLQVLEECHRSAIPHAGAVREFILFDRIFRYPGEADWSRNFDSGTGLVLLEHLRRENAIRVEGGRFAFNWDDIMEACTKFIEMVKSIEVIDDTEYLRDARRCIDEFLPAKTSDVTRFGLPRFIAGTSFEPYIGRAPILTFSTSDLDVGSVDYLVYDQ